MKGGLGDVLCTEPAARACKMKFPYAHVTWGLDNTYYPLYADYENVDRVISLKAGASGLRKTALAKYDLFFPLDGPERRHEDESGGVMTKSRPHVWCESIGYVPDDLCPRWEARPSEREAIHKGLEALNVQPFEYILLGWGSINTAKDYPYSWDLAKLLVEQGKKVFVVHHRNIPEIEGVVEVVRVPFRELGGLCEQAAIGIGPDSGLCHFCAATKTPFIALCGPTDGNVYFSDYPHCTVLQGQGTHDRACENLTPCWGKPEEHWCKKRVRHAPWCMEAWSPEYLADLLDQKILEYRPHNEDKKEIFNS